MMELRVLAVPDCPNVALLDQRLRDVVGVRGDVRIEHQVIDDPAQAARAGMNGSPTLLIGGADPFAGPGTAPGVSCRLYRDAEGRVQGAPSVAQLRAALRCGPESLPGLGLPAALPAGVGDIAAGRA